MLLGALALLLCFLCLANLQNSYKNCASEKEELQKCFSKYKVKLQVYNTATSNTILTNRHATQRKMYELNSTQGETISPENDIKDYSHMMSSRKQLLIPKHKRGKRDTASDTVSQYKLWSKFTSFNATTDFCWYV